MGGFGECGVKYCRLFSVHISKVHDHWWEIYSIDSCVLDTVWMLCVHEVIISFECGQVITC